MVRFSTLALHADHRRSHLILTHSYLRLRETHPHRMQTKHIQKLQGSSESPPTPSILQPRETGSTPIITMTQIPYPSRLPTRNADCAPSS